MKNNFIRFVARLNKLLITVLYRAVIFCLARFVCSTCQSLEQFNSNWKLNLMLFSDCYRSHRYSHQLPIGRPIVIRNVHWKFPCVHIYASTECHRQNALQEFIDTKNHKFFMPFNVLFVPVSMLKHILQNIANSN